MRGKISKKFPNKVNFLFTLLRHRLSQRFNDLFTLLGFQIHLCQNASQMFINIFFQDFSQPLRKRTCSQIPWIDISIYLMRLKILLLFIQSHADLYFIIDLLLRSVLYAHIPQF